MKLTSELAKKSGIEKLRWHGETIVIRPIRPEDDIQHRQFLEQINPEDIRMRIFYSKRELSNDELARLTHIDYEREMAFIAERVVMNEVNQTLATIRLVSNLEGNSAEFAMIVRSDLKHLGLGKLMLNKAVLYAKEKGLKQLVGSVLRENTAMLELATQSGFKTDSSVEVESTTRNLILTL